MQNFAAIDFETANQHRSSVCSLGVVIVRDGKIVDDFYSLIHPTPNFYCRFTTAIHGLSIKDTENAPYFPEVWLAAASKIGDLPLVAHNKSFDESCLKAVFNAYDLPYPDYPFYCTLRGSRQCFNLPNYQLDTVAQYVGFELENHHHALYDAQACAAIALKLWEN